MMNRLSLRLLKYGVVAFLAFSGIQVAANHCAVMNERAEALEVLTSNPSCFENDLESLVLMYSAGGLFLLMLGAEVMLA